MSHSDARTEADFSFGLYSVEFGQDTTSVWCQCGEDLTIATSEQDKKIPTVNYHLQHDKTDQQGPGHDETAEMDISKSRVQLSVYCQNNENPMHEFTNFITSYYWWIRKRNAYFAIVMSPTLFSGLLRVLEWQTMLTASCWACSLVGRKSPFLMYSLLSTLRERYQFDNTLASVW